MDVGCLMPNMATPGDGSITRTHDLTLDIVGCLPLPSVLTLLITAQSFSVHVKLEARYPATSPGIRLLRCVHPVLHYNVLQKIPSIAVWCT
jgi:hypothetical protein